MRKRKLTARDRKKGTHEVHIVLNMDLDTCQIHGTGDSLFDLLILMEGLGVSIAQNKRQGMSEQEIDQRVLRYYESIKDAYTLPGEVLTLPTGNRKE